MDPITQGAVGSAAAQALTTSERKHRLVAIAAVGAAAGMAPDLDVLIQSPTDPLLFLEFHRQFTHSLVFTPLGALIVASCVYPFVRGNFAWREIYLMCLIGYATHGVLDACTSYGTQLFWPFSNMRVAWNNVSVVDPMFTLPLLACVVVAAIRRQKIWSYIGVAWGIAYLGFGLVQYHRALDAGDTLAAQRGHAPSRLDAKPAFGNILLWKVIYDADGFYFVDAIRAGANIETCGGEQARRFGTADRVSNLPADHQHTRDIERFRWFSDDFLAVRSHMDKQLIFDIRYSMLPSDIDPLWGIVVDPSTAKHQHVEWWTDRSMSATQRRQFTAMLAGEACVPIEIRAEPITS